MYRGKLQVAFSKASTRFSCAVPPSTPPSSSPVLSSVNGLWIMVFRSCGSTTMLGNGTRTFQFWDKDQQNELSELNSSFLYPSGCLIL
ncbi:hypothetical protein LINGRAHAP2_LOCUS13089 [Linum grandiflorum]